MPGVLFAFAAYFAVLHVLAADTRDGNAWF